MGNVQLSYSGIGEMLTSDWMVDEMVRRAEKISARAEATAPVDTTGPHPGRYKAAFRVESESHGGVHHDRAEARVVNDADEAFYVEYGNRNTPRHRTLGQAADAARD